MKDRPHFGRPATLIPRYLRIMQIMRIKLTKTPLESGGREHWSWKAPINRRYHSYSNLFQFAKIQRFFLLEHGRVCGQRIAPSLDEDAGREHSWTRSQVCTVLLRSKVNDEPWVFWWIRRSPVESSPCRRKIQRPQQWDTENLRKESYAGFYR